MEKSRDRYRGRTRWQDAPVAISALAFVEVGESSCVPFSLRFPNCFIAEGDRR